MNKIKSIIKSILRPSYHKIILIYNFIVDFRLFKKYSLAFNSKSLLNKEANLILNYHSIEKGMLFKNMKKGFGAERIKKLHVILNDSEIIENINRSQIRVGYQVVCQYYELHQEKAYNIEELYSKQQYLKYKGILNRYYDKDFKGTYSWNNKTFYNNVYEDFKTFSSSRKSTRDFTGKIIEIERINNAIELANNAPSVCNRQASNVYLVEDKIKIDQLLEIQGGLTGYTKNISQLLILTNDRSFYYTVGERNQFYIDGGIYLMNLLYALHYYKIGNCPANWGKTIADENKLSKIISIPKSEKIICFIAIGDLVENFNTTLSARRPFTENFFKI
ncbi:nitroreductase family protein [Flavobacterium agricola]|uniref:Nitroreductase family protein n=1 Tax=Flavobacterium agricola TaxID=2870839 RepID=A0ABY6M409_9FLAO|nr:nitroreductase family protein [Flavobacterium agricola]UYW02031.1 nitroreductase family protein [Flavobacterium agricola]